MRDWLIDGGHKMYKIPVQKEEDKSRLNAWLKRNNLPDIDDEEKSNDDKN